MLANASPRNPYVPIDVKSSKDLSLDVVNLSHKIGKSSFYSKKGGGKRQQVSLFSDAGSF